MANGNQVGLQSDGQLKWWEVDYDWLELFPLFFNGNHFFLHFESISVSFGIFFLLRRLFLVPFFSSFFSLLQNFCFPFFLFYFSIVVPFQLLNFYFISISSFRFLFHFGCLETLSKEFQISSAHLLQFIVRRTSIFILIPHF